MEEWTKERYKGPKEKRHSLSLPSQFGFGTSHLNLENNFINIFTQYPAQGGSNLANNFQGNMNMMGGNQDLTNYPQLPPGYEAGNQALNTAYAFHNQGSNDQFSAGQLPFANQMSNNGNVALPIIPSQNNYPEYAECQQKSNSIMQYNPMEEFARFDQLGAKWINLKRNLYGYNNNWM